MILVADFLRFKALVSLLGFKLEGWVWVWVRSFEFHKLPFMFWWGVFFRGLGAISFLACSCGELCVGPRFILTRLGCGCPFLFGTGLSLDRWVCVRGFLRFFRRLSLCVRVRFWALVRESRFVLFHFNWVWCERK
jgi:hypothetical protein